MTDDELRRLAEAARDTEAACRANRTDETWEAAKAAVCAMAEALDYPVVIDLLDRLLAAEAGWRRIETAPREPHEIDVPMALGSIRRIRMGPSVMLRGEIEGGVIEAEGCWSIKNDEPGYWWNTDGEEPATWATHWRPLPAAPEPTP